MLKKIMPGLANITAVCACIAITAYSIYINSVPDYTFERIAGSSDATETVCYTSCCACYKIDWMNLIAYMALLILFLFAASIIVERWLIFYYAGHQSREFKERMAEALSNNRCCDALNIAALYPKSPLALVIKACLQRDQDGFMTSEIKPSIEARQRAIVMLTEQLKRGLWNLAAASWTIPLIGLLILVAGLVNTLYGMRASEGSAPFYVYRSFIDSFWATTWSLLITIPVIWFRKCFAAKVEMFTLEIDKLSLAIISQITSQQKRSFTRTTTEDCLTQRLDTRQTNRLPI